MWRTLKDPAVVEYPHELRVRPMTIREFRSIEPLSAADQEAFVLEHCCKVDGAPACGVDVHVAAALVRGVMKNPWNGPQQTESSDC
jgi:hypothetical protein